MKQTKQVQYGRIIVLVTVISVLTTTALFAAEVGGKPEKADVVVTYAQSSLKRPIFTQTDRI